MIKILMISLLLCNAVHHANGQILISLLLGDKLNSEELKFGLDGGIAVTSFSNSDEAESRSALFLGFYFDILLKENWSLFTGMMVKSPMGARGLAPYAVGNEDLDQLLESSSVKRKLSYFNVPILLKYSLPNYIFLKGGIQIGLLRKSVDEFSASVNSEELLYSNKIRDQYNLFDFGLSAGAGYQLMQGNGISIGLRYYGGLVNIREGTDERNSALYIFASIPIGAVNEQEILSD